MHKKFIINLSEMNEVTYKRIRNKFNKMKKAAKKKYYSDRLEKALPFDTYLTKF